MPLTPSMQKEQFSLAFVRAVASAAGYNVKTYAVDDDSIDLGLAGDRRVGSIVRAPQLDIQVKCTATDDGQGAVFPFDLSIKNFDDLRDPQLHIPRILVVVCVPEAVEEWLHEMPEATAMRRCAYWTSLRGRGEAGGATASRVHLDRQQRFTVSAVRSLMDQIGAGGTP